MDGSWHPDAEIWSILGIGETTSLPAIKRAYAERLKACRPETDPEGFQRLRAAFEAARAYSRAGSAPPPSMPPDVSPGTGVPDRPEGSPPSEPGSPAGPSPEDSTFRTWGEMPADEAGKGAGTVGDTAAKSTGFRYPLFETDPDDLPAAILDPVNDFLALMKPVLHAEFVDPGRETWLNLLAKARFETKETQEWAGYALFSLILTRMEDSNNFFGQCADLDPEVWREMDKMFGWSVQEMEYEEFFEECEWTDYVFHLIAKAWGREGQKSFNRFDWVFWLIMAPILAPLGFIYFFFKTLFLCCIGRGPGEEK